MKMHICPPWLSFSLDNRIRRMIHDPEIILKRFILPGDTVVDIGCGPGYFAIPMAFMVGEKGKVIAVDLQDKMITKLKANIKKSFLIKNRIEPVICEPNDLKVEAKADFVLTFWMVHEVTDVDGLFRQIKEILKPGAYYLLSEPKYHVPKKQYSWLLGKAEAAGFKQVEEGDIALSRSMIFTV
jgi:ubiquinone/menaquinone biosynthesis C-methylase UbiE